MALLEPTNLLLPGRIRPHHAEEGIELLLRLHRQDRTAGSLDPASLTGAVVPLRALPAAARSAGRPVGGSAGGGEAAAAGW